MKTALCFLLLTIGCASLVCGAGQAAAADVTELRQKTRPPAQQESHARAAEQRHSHGSASLPKPNVPKHPASARRPSTRGKAMNTHRPRSSPRNNSASTALAQSHALNNARSVHAQKVARPSPVPNSVLHHSPNPSTVGGPARSSIANTTAINGSRVSRRP